MTILLGVNDTPQRPRDPGVLLISLSWFGSTLPPRCSRPALSTLRFMSPFVPCWPDAQEDDQQQGDWCLLPFSLSEVFLFRPGSLSVYHCCESLGRHYYVRDVEYPYYYNHTLNESRWDPPPEWYAMQYDQDQNDALCLFRSNVFLNSLMCLVSVSRRQ